MNRHSTCRRARAKGRVLITSLTVAMVLTFSRPVEPQTPRSATEYELKAAFLYNFATFVEWPAGTFTRADAPIRFCVFGRDPFGRDLEKILAGKRVSGHAIEILRVTTARALSNCHVVFFAAADPQDTKEALQSLSTASILTVGEARDFVQQGGMIAFVLEQDRLRFQINMVAARAANLDISSKLLSLAKAVWS